MSFPQRPDSFLHTSQTAEDIRPFLQADTNIRAEASKCPAIQANWKNAAESVYVKYDDFSLLLKDVSEIADFFRQCKIALFDINDIDIIHLVAERLPSQTSGANGHGHAMMKVPAECGMILYSLHLILNIILLQC